MNGMDPATSDHSEPIEHSVAHTKRFLECWSADPAFRERLAADPLATVRECKLLVDPERIRPLYDSRYANEQQRSPGVPVSEEVAAYRRFILSRTEMVRSARQGGAPLDRRFRRWRQRQMNRALWELGPQAAQSLIHAPVCFELSRGCTVKCWFCGIGARPFGGHLPYDQPGRALWREVLGVIRDLCGPAAAHGFCYWATDPLDNPDYEQFLEDFWDLLGRWPQTTTAIPLRDVARTRALLGRVAARKGLLTRFSVLSMGLYRRIMAEFSAEELLDVELIPQFSEEASPKVVSGASRRRALRVHAQKNVPLPVDIEDGGTIACVSGWLLNMVERSVKLISPCSASARWPLGYITFREFRFADAEDLRRRIQDSIDACMPAGLPADLPLRFHRCFTVEERGDGFALRSPHGVVVRYEKMPAGSDLARRLQRGDQTAAEIAAARQEGLGLAPELTGEALSKLFDQGTLSEEPGEEGRALG